MNATLHIPIDAVKALCRRHRVRELAVFGSALGSDFRPDSDVDLLVDFEPDAEVGFLEFAALQNELSDLLHRKVDLVPKRGLKHLIRDDILTSAQVIHAA
jgi:predicted nucleotidyltransferase